MHQSIRWESISRHIESMNPETQTSWFMVNFDSEAPSPQPIPRDQRLDLGENAPELFIPDGNYTNAVDIWDLG